MDSLLAIFFAWLGWRNLSLLVRQQRTNCYHSERHQQQYIWRLHQYFMAWVTFTYLIPNFSCQRKRKETWSCWLCVGKTRLVQVLQTRSPSYDLPIVSLYELPLTKLKEAARRWDIGFLNVASSWGFFDPNPPPRGNEYVHPDPAWLSPCYSRCYFFEGNYQLKLFLLVLLGSGMTHLKSRM